MPSREDGVFRVSKKGWDIPLHWPLRSKNPEEHWQLVFDELNQALKKEHGDHPPLIIVLEKFREGHDKEIQTTVSRDISQFKGVVMNSNCYPPVLWISRLLPKPAKKIYLK